MVPPVEEAGGTPAPARGASEARMARELFPTNTSPRSRSFIRVAFSPNRVAAEGEPAPATTPTSLKHLRDKIRKLDVNGDGVIDEQELAAAVDTIISGQRMNKVYSYTAIASFIMMCLLIAAIGGLTYGIVVATRDTKIADGSVMVSSKDGQNVVQLASYDMAIVDNSIVARQALPGVITASPLGTTSATNASTASAVLKTAGFTTQQAFTSRVPIKALMELRYLYLEGVGGAELAIQVHGVARVPQAGSRWGTVVQIRTPAGTITLDDTEITFSEDSAPLFANAGFITKGRRLLSSYDVYGFFNYIADMSVFSLPPTEHFPQMPNGDYNMTLKIYSPCTGPDGKEKCLMNVTSTNSSVVKDIPGVVTLSGARYVTHYETSIRSGSLARTVYNYPAWPTWRKVEVVDMDLSTLSAWLVLGDFNNDTLQVPSINSTNSTSYDGTPFNNYLCRQLELPALLANSLANRGGGALMNATGQITVTFMGFENVSHVGGTPRAARHFKLVVPQTGNQSLPLPANVTINYWDLQDANNTPFLLTVDLPWGTVRNEFISVASLTAVDQSIFNVPDNDTCVQSLPPSLGLFWLHDAFVQPSSQALPMFTTADTSAYVNYTGPGTNRTVSPSAGRHLLGDLTGLQPLHGAARRLQASACNTAIANDYNPSAVSGISVHYTQWTDPGGKIIVHGDPTYGTVVKMSGDLNFEWCSFYSYAVASGCITLTVGVNKLGTLSATACGGYDAGYQTFYVTPSVGGQFASIGSSYAGFNAVINFKPCGSTACVWVESITAFARCPVNLWFWSYQTDCVGFPFTSLSNYWIQGSQAQLDAARPIGFYAGTPSSLLGQDVMLYSARTAAVPGYLCLDPNYGGNGGAAFMRPCDENNANHRFSIVDAGGGYVNLIENYSGYRRCITADSLVNNQALYYARDCVAGNQAQKFQISEAVSGQYAIKSPAATRSDGTLVTKCLDNNNNELSHFPWTWDCVAGVNNQYWLLKSPSSVASVTHASPNTLVGAHIMIRSALSGDWMCVDSDGAAPGTVMHLWNCDPNNDNQRWLLTQRSDGFFNIKTFKNGDIRCLGVNPENYNGAHWYTLDCDGSTNQQFGIVPSPRGAGYIFFNKYNGKCLDTWSGDRGFNPTTWDCNIPTTGNLLPNQEWDISIQLKSFTVSYTQLIGRTVMIYSVRSGDTLCLEAGSGNGPGGRPDGIVAKLSNCDPIANGQRWLVTDAGNGAISMKLAVESFRCLDVDDYFYIFNDGAYHEVPSLEDMNLVRYRVQNCNSSPTQQFYLYPAGDGAGFNIKGGHSGRCLDYYPPDGPAPRQWDCNDGVWQHWDFVVIS